MLINDEIQRQVLPVLARATVVPPAEVQQRAGAQLQLNPGQQVKAEIIANLPNNLYLARIAGEMFKLEIPLNVPPGETLEMTFLSADPRITFQFTRPETRESVSLSSMGKWLAGVVRDAPPLPLQEALLDSPEQGAALLGERLKAAVTRSGLFYESHLARWAAGGLPAAELFREPQGKLSRAARREEPREEDPGSPVLEDGIADARTLPLVKQQLLFLNTGVLSWRGEAWPGQGMQIEVTRREAGERELEAELSLVLPHLGGVRAQLRLGEEGLHLEFVCDRPGSAEVLREASGALRPALASAGVSLARMAVKDEEHDR